VSPSVLELTYTTRKYGPTNKWGPGISFNDESGASLINILLQPLGAKLGYLAQAEGFCK
jgi:hypothetical protein